MIEENKTSKIKQYKNLIITVGSVFGISAIFLFYGQPKQNQSDISKIINSKNKIMLQDPNRGLKAEDRWIEEAGQKLEDYDEFQKNYGQDKSNIESRLAEVEKKYEDTISAQSELLEGQGKEIADLKNKISFSKQGVNPKDPFTVQGQEGSMQAVPPAPKTIQSIHLNLEEDKAGEGEFFNSEEYFGR